MYKRKTVDVFDIQADYGYGDGFETVTAETTYKAARAALRDYRLNDYNARAFRIKVTREKIQPAVDNAL